MVTFSATDRASFDAVKRWKKTVGVAVVFCLSCLVACVTHALVEQVEAEVGPIPMVVVQNKVDLLDKARSALEDVRVARSLSSLFGFAMLYSPRSRVVSCRHYAILRLHARIDAPYEATRVALCNAAVQRSPMLSRASDRRRCCREGEVELWSSFRLEMGSSFVCSFK